MHRVDAAQLKYLLTLPVSVFRNPKFILLVYVLSAPNSLARKRLSYRFYYVAFIFVLK